MNNGEPRDEGDENGDGQSDAGSSPRSRTQGTAGPRGPRPLRSALMGASLAAAIATLVLLIGTLVTWTRSPLSMTMVSPLLHVVGTGAVALVGAWALRPSVRLMRIDVWGATGILVFLALIGCAVVGTETSEVIRTTRTVPAVTGWLVTAWACLSIAVLTHIAARAPRRAERSAARLEDDSPDPEGDSETASALDDASSPDAAPAPTGRAGAVGRVGPGLLPPRGERMTRLRAAAVGAAAVMVLASAVPAVINEHLDPLIRITVDEASEEPPESFPAVEEIATAASAQSQPAIADPDWTTSVDSHERHLLAGAHGAVLVTSEGAYGLDSETGRVTWCFGTTGLRPESSADDGYDDHANHDDHGNGALLGVDIYAGRSAFTSPDGEWLAYAFDITPGGSTASTSPSEKLSRVVVLSTGTGRVALDTQIAGATPTVQLTDSMAVVGRRVYDLADGHELTPLDAGTAAIPGPGGHTNVLLHDKGDDDTDQSASSLSVSSRPAEYFRMSQHDRKHLGDGRRLGRIQRAEGRPMNVGGWIVNPIDVGSVQEIDTGRTVFLDNAFVDNGREISYDDGWEIIRVEASSQAIVVWAFDRTLEGDLETTDLHPLSMSVLDTRTGTKMPIDTADLYRRSVSGTRHSAHDMAFPLSVGVVDSALFSTQTEDYGRYNGKFVVGLNDEDGRSPDSRLQEVRLANGTILPWAVVTIPSVMRKDADSVLCADGMIVSVEPRDGGVSAGARAELTGRRAPRG